MNKKITFDEFFKTKQINFVLNLTNWENGGKIIKDILLPTTVGVVLEKILYIQIVVQSGTFAISFVLHILYLNLKMLFLTIL
mgnify:CR=1 FL=1